MKIEINRFLAKNELIEFWVKYVFNLFWTEIKIYRILIGTKNKFIFLVQIKLIDFWLKIILIETGRLLTKMSFNQTWK